MVIIIEKNKKLFFDYFHRFVAEAEEVKIREYPK